MHNWLTQGVGLNPATLLAGCLTAVLIGGAMIGLGWWSDLFAAVANGVRYRQWTCRPTLPLVSRWGKA
jgi:hypothetical protein